MIYLVLFTPVAAWLVYLLIRRLLLLRRQKQRAAARAQPFPAPWRQTLTADFPLYHKLPPELRQRLEDHIQVFVREKVFVGCDGFVITDAVRVLIAAQACLLILNTDNDYYPGFETILVYPQAYVAPVTHQDGHLHTQGMDARAGESWHRGPLIVAWDQVLQGARDGRDGHNVVMHEFAHKLDEENAHMDGLPILSSAAQYRPWSEVLNKEFESLQQSHDGVIDEYGATSAAEFFAVVTETFFEKPEQLQQRHPELYRQFQLYYRLDPVSWSDPNKAG